jgi:hypothetical protein
MAGFTTNCLTRILNSIFPDDKIIKSLEEVEDFHEEKSVRFGERGSMDFPTRDRADSIGMMTRVENFDRNYLQKLLRKDNWEDQGEFFHNEFVEPFEQFDDSQEARYSHMMGTGRGGDLSPHRASIMHK